MKTLRLLFLAILLPLFFACENESVSEFKPDPPSEAQEHKIPLENALADLNSMLEAIDGADTRSGGMRHVSSVKTLCAADIVGSTRGSSSDGSHLGDLVYIVNFEDGEGYAILGADDRIESVIAITEQGSLTTAQLAAAAAGEYNGIDAPPVIPEIGDYLVNGTNLIIRDSLISWGGGPALVQTTYGPWNVVSQKGPYCQMRWGQDSPYKMRTPIKDGVHCVVGCVAVALGQIVATNYYNKYYPYNTSPEPTILGGQPVFWREIFNSIKTYIDYPSTPRYFDVKEDNSQVQAVAYFLSGIGQAIGMEYGITSSSSSRHDAARFLKAMGFKDVDIYYFSEGKLKEMVADRGLPTYIRGHGLYGGHAWVVDGVKSWNRNITRYYTNPVSSSTSIENRLLYHCNFGWKGICDGYYNAGSVFNPRGNPTETEIGDVPSNNTGDNLTSETRIIYYNLF